MKTKKPDLQFIIDTKNDEIEELKSKIYGLMVDNEYLKIKLAEVQSPEERRATLSLLTFNKPERKQI